MCDAQVSAPQLAHMGLMPVGLALNKATKKAPNEITILELGQYLGHPDGPFEITQADLVKGKENFDRRDTDLVVDYEHASLWAEQAPAAGWVKELKVRSGDLVAKVEWTEEAAAYIEKEEYRYLSPVLDFQGVDHETGAPIGLVLHSVALTNTPFMDLPPVLNKSKGRKPNSTKQKEQDNMDWKTFICKALGLDPEKATDQEIGEKLGVDLDGAAPEEITLALNKATASEDPGEPGEGGEPGGDETGEVFENRLKAVEDKLAAGDQEKAEAQAEVLVANAIKAGHLAPAVKDAAITLAVNDPKAFGDLIQGTPSMVGGAKSTDNAGGEVRINDPSAMLYDHYKSQEG